MGLNGAYSVFCMCVCIYIVWSVCYFRIIYITYSEFLFLFAILNDKSNLLH
jgi:hypothetical protein